MLPYRTRDAADIVRIVTSVRTDTSVKSTVSTTCALLLRSETFIRPSRLKEWEQPMEAERSPREYAATLCSGTLYERLAIAAELPEAAERAATEWNELALILSTVGGHVLHRIDSPALDASAMQRRILAGYATHPLLRRQEPLSEVLRREPVSRESLELVAAADAQHQARYIDRVREELGLTSYSLV